MKNHKKFAKDGVRTHAHIREVDLKSTALTTRPPGLILIFKSIEKFILFLKIIFQTHSFTGIASRL